MRLMFISALLFTSSIFAQEIINNKIENKEINFFIHECWSKSGLLEKVTSESGNKSKVCADKGLLTSRPLYKKDFIMSKEEKRYKHFCYETKGSVFNSLTIYSNEQNEKVACKAEGLTHDISTFHNGTSCSDFASNFLRARGLGELRKPSDKVRVANFGTLKDRLPQFNIESKNGDRISSKAIEKNLGTSWQLTIESLWDVPSLEKGLVNSTNIFNKGNYKRTYNFDVVGGSCVVRSVNEEFLPDGKNETAKSTRSLSLQPCVALAKSHDEKRNSLTAKSDLLDGVSLNEYVCSEILELFSEPHNSKDKLLIKDKESIRGTR